MRRGPSIVSAVLLTACMLGCTACSNSFEGSGSKTAATAEQLAQVTADPWDGSQSVSNSKLAGDYKDGTYTGEGQGMDGWIRVTISIKDDVLTVESIQQEGETQSVGGYEAIRDGVYANQIDTAQGDEIDGVSGATVTTFGVKSALDDALSQAEE